MRPIGDENDFVVKACGTGRLSDRRQRQWPLLPRNTCCYDTWLEFRACFVELTRTRATSLFSYAKPNKQVRVLAFTSFNGYEPRASLAVRCTRSTAREARSPFDDFEPG